MNVLETRVLQTIGESTTSPDVFTDNATGMAQIRGSLNDAIEEVCILAGMRKSVFFIPLESGVNLYNIGHTSGTGTERYAWPVSVWLVNQKRKLDRVDLIWMATQNPLFLKNTGTPFRYFEAGHSKMGVDPTPSSSTDMLEVTSISVPKRYELDTDRIKIRHAYRWACVHFAVSEYYASRGDAKRATHHFMQYLKQLGMMELYPETKERRWEFKSR